MAHPSDCRKRLAELSEYIDGSAQEQVCREIEKHMESCPDCRIMVDTLRKTITLCRDREKEIGLPEQARRRLYRRLELDDLLPAAEDRN
jgi:predicted anti-sigma-YlaC factor YlaD